jgi:hypothetical protein
MKQLITGCQEVRPRPENQERRGLHTRPLTSALKDKTSLVSGSPALAPDPAPRSGAALILLGG